MIDPEVARLRRLRALALRVRAIARMLGSKPYVLNDSLLGRGAGASWRIVRAVTGRLKAHPYASYQQDPGFGRQVSDTLFASFLAFGAGNRPRAMAAYESHLWALARQLADVRALTWAPDLSDGLGRSQFEINSLLEAVARETGRTDGRLQWAPGLPLAANGAGDFANPLDGGWPYMAF